MPESEHQCVALATSLTRKIYTFQNHFVLFIARTSLRCSLTIGCLVGPESKGQRRKLAYLFGFYFQICIRESEREDH